MMEICATDYGATFETIAPEKTEECVEKLGHTICYRYRWAPIGMGIRGQLPPGNMRA